MYMDAVNLVFSVNLIVNGKSLASLSQEEMESLQEALGTKSNEEALISASVVK